MEEINKEKTELLDAKKSKAFDFAADTTKQLINISTGIIALMVTFSKDIVANSNTCSKSLLAWTWSVFILSIIFGVMTLMALTGTLQPKEKTSKKRKEDEVEKEDEPKADINNNNIRLLASLQVGVFLIAIILTVIFGYSSFNTEKENVNKNKYPIIRESTLNGDSTKVYIDTLYLDKK